MGAIIPKPGGISGGHPKSAQKSKLASLPKLLCWAHCSLTDLLLLINRPVAVGRTPVLGTVGVLEKPWHESHGVLKTMAAAPSQDPCNDDLGSWGVLGAAEHQHSVPLTAPPHCFCAFQRLSAAKTLTKALLKPVGKQRVTGL